MKSIDKKIPCIKNKCILFPVCRNKYIIKCSILEEYFISLERCFRNKAPVHNDEYNPVELAWSIVKNVLPKLIELRIDDEHTWRHRDLKYKI